MQRAPLDALEALPAIDRIAEHVDDAAQQLLAHGDLKGMARIEDEPAAGEAGGGGQGDPSDGFRVEMADHLDHDTAVVSGSQLAVELGEAVRKAGVHDAAAYGQHGTPTKVVVIVQQDPLTGDRQLLHAM